MFCLPDEIENEDIENKIRNNDEAQQSHLLTECCHRYSLQKESIQIAFMQVY